MKPKPYKITRNLLLDGKNVRIVPVHTEQDKDTIITTFALVEPKPKSSSKRHFLSKQGKRILAAFQAAPDTDIPATWLHRAGSGKDGGWCASISRRLSDLRALGHNIVKTVDKTTKDGQRTTSYRLIKNPELYS